MKRFLVAKLLILALFLFPVFGCREAPLDLAVRYNSLGDLKPDGAVYIDQTRVGQIEKIVSTEQGDYLVKIAIESEFKNKATEYSRFLLSADPLDRGKAAIVIDQSRAGGRLLESGRIVKGQHQGMLGQFLSRLQQTGSEASMELQSGIEKFKQALTRGSQQLSASLDRTLSEMGRSLDELQESWQSDKTEEKMAKMQRDIDNFIHEFKKSGAEIQEKMRQEIIPEIKKQLQELEQKMRQEDYDKDADLVEKRMNEITRI